MKRTNDMDTKEYPTFCYDTVGMENGLKPLTEEKLSFVILLMLMSLVRNRVYSVQTHALFQNLHAQYSIFKKNFNFSSNLKFFWMLLFWVLYTYVVYKITNKQLVTK